MILSNISLSVALLFLTETAAGETIESCADKGVFTPECTQIRASLADENHDGIITQDEADKFLRKYDWPVQKAVASGKQLDKQLEIAWFDILTFRGEDIIDTPVDSATFLGAALYRNRLWRSSVGKAKSNRVKYSASRRLGDTVDPRGGSDVKSRPVLLAYREDRVSKEAGVQLLGTFSANFSPLLERSRGSEGSGYLTLTPSIGIAFDVDTSSKSRGKNKSDINIGPALSMELKGNHDASRWTDHYFTIAPTYQTDADFNRSVVNVAASYSFASTSLGRPGLNNTFCEKCSISTWIWYWRPSIQLIAGSIHDAGGNETLELLKANGSYLRFVPSVSFRLFPENSASSIGFEWQGLRDNDGRYRTYRELSYQYDIRTNLAFTAIYRKGTKPSSFQYVDSILFGFGFQY